MHMKQPTHVTFSMVYGVMVFTMIDCKSVSIEDEGSTQASERSQSETAPRTETTSAGSESESDTGAPDPISYTEPGPFPFGNVAMALADPVSDRDLDVELWYPASRDATGAGQALVDFVIDETNAATLQALVDVAPDECVRKQTASASAPQLAAIAGPWPTVVFSHCHGCARFSSFSLAERLASHGFLVASVDHAGNTMFEQDSLPPIDIDTLHLR